MGRPAVARHLFACAAAAVVAILVYGFRRSYHLEANVKSAATCVVKMRTGADMKVNVEIDCTPLEARQFFGLPDVGPMQVAVMDKLQQQMSANIDSISPDALLKSWFSFDPKLAERFQDMFMSMAGLGTLSGDKKK
jgi:uncharacterized protein DUF6489